MSLKDDFLEALRSVKRDFIGDYKAAPPDAPQETERSAAPQPAEHTAPTDREDIQREEAAPPISERPHIRDTFQPELHTPAEVDMPPRNAAFDIEKDALSGDMDSSSAPSFPDDSDAGMMDGGNGFGFGGGGGDDGEPPDDGDGRFIMDDDFESPGDERTVISKNTVIRGALQTDDSVRMFGQVLGDIECRSNILVAGKVRGNTSAANAYVIGAQVDGNLLCDDVINVTDDAWILGNIRAQQADVDGKIKGNIEIRHSILIGKNSSVIGNISTDELEIKRGAFVNGQIMMYSPSRDVIDRFDSFDQ